jgi:hypothetical protein
MAKDKALLEAANDGARRGYTLSVIDQNIHILEDERYDDHGVPQSHDLTLFPDDTSVILLALDRLRQEIVNGRVPLYVLLPVEELEPQDDE